VDISWSPVYLVNSVVGEGIDLAKKMTFEVFGFILTTTPIGYFSIQQGENNQGIPV
jgi:hypothetical protein